MDAYRCDDEVLMALPLKPRAETHREFKREVDGNTGTSAEFDGAVSGYWSAAALDGHVSFATTQKK